MYSQQNLPWRPTEWGGAVEEHAVILESAPSDLANFT